MTAELLAFSKAAGNDLSTPMPAYGFAGLKPAGRWPLAGIDRPPSAMWRSLSAIAHCPCAEGRVPTGD